MGGTYSTKNEIRLDPFQVESLIVLPPHRSSYPRSQKLGSVRRVYLPRWTGEHGVNFQTLRPYYVTFKVPVTLLVFSVTLGTSHEFGTPENYSSCQVPYFLLYPLPWTFRPKLKVETESSRHTGDRRVS